MPRRLKLTKYAVTHVNYDYLGAYRMRIEASDAEDVEPHVFLYRRGQVNPYTGTTSDTFFAVASPVDMAEYPPLAPDPNTSFPFFRLSFIELDFRATRLALEAYQTIVTEVDTLLKALDRLEQLTPVETVWVGAGAPADDSPGTSSSSDVSESSAASEGG